MKTTRTFASLCLTASCIALFAAANVSVGDQPGVFRTASAPQEETPAVVQNGLQPTPDGTVPRQDGAGQFNLNGGGPINARQFVQQSTGVTERIIATQGFATQSLFGPQVTFQQNVDSSLGQQDSFTRANLRLPNHLMPNTTLLNIDVAANVTDEGDGLYNMGFVFRAFDEARNRIVGLNLFLDSDNSGQLSDYTRVGAGYENLGRYIDFIANGYWVTSEDSFLSSRTALPELSLQGNNVVRSFMETRENAYSGADAKIGGPLPWLGRRGVNGYIGAYYFANDFAAEDALGVSAELQLLATNAFEVSAFYTNDDAFGTNSWVSFSYTIPPIGPNRVLRPKTVQERLMDPVRRTSTVHNKVETTTGTEAVVNTKTGLPYFLLYVDPNATADGTGTLESPFMTLAAANAANAATVDAIRVIPRSDDTGTNLTVPGGITLFDEQALFSSHKDFTLFADATGSFVIPATPSLSGMGPLISDPTITAGNSVITVADWNSVNGFRIDAANSLGTEFGNGIAGTDVDGTHISCNVFTNYVVGTSIAGDDELLFDDNTFTGLAGVSTNGLMVTTTIDSTSDLRVRENTATNNSSSGIYVRAGSGSTINADNPLGFGLLPSDPTALPGPGGLPVPVFGSGAVEATGIVDNQVSAGGDGIVVTADAGATIDLVVEGNTSTDNTFNGFIGRADGGTIELVSMRENTFSSNLETGALLNFLNGGSITSLTEDVNGDGILNPSEDTNGNGILDPAEDINGNGILDPGEDTNGNGVLDPAEDLDGDGLIAAAEDINGNGLLDQGIVSNTMSNNGTVGLCLFGQDASTGDFDIGGPFVGLGNTFSGNAGAGIGVDLQDSSTAGIDALFNTITGSGDSGPASLTIVLDFIDPAQGSVVDALGRTVNPFDVTAYGFAAADFDTVTNAILQTVQNHYSSIPTVGADSRSPIPDGFGLDIDFVIGDAGVAPSNGATEYYAVTIGDSAQNLGGLAGQAADIGNIRNAMGQGPGQGLDGVAQAIGESAAAVYTNGINSFSPLLTPPDAFNDPTAVILDGELSSYAVNALTSGDLTFTRRAIGLVTSHELGHTLSLRHILASSAVTPTGAAPLMGTPAFDLPLQSLLEPVEFAFSGTNPGEIPGEAPFTQNSIEQLVTAVGLRSSDTAGPQANGITIVANDSARLRPSTFIENTISGSTNRGLNVEMNDMAVAESVTIQGNDITGNGTGIRLAANGPDAIINADNTVGGTDMNLLGGSMFAQGNTITNGTGDGFQAAVADGGTVVGNLLNNNISSNGGNGASFLIERGGTIDFGTTADRIIAGNTIDQNAGHGIFANSNVDDTVPNTGQAMDLVIQGNSITGNQTGGVFAELNGLNNVPPGPPVAGFEENNVLNLTIGQTTMPFGTPVTDESNTITDNGGVGVGLVVGGTGLANVSVVQNIITGTTTGSDPLFTGDGIKFIRRDSSLLLADILNNTVTGNADDGMEVDTQGTNRTNMNQPQSGTINSVTWNNNIFDNNGNNGVAFRTRGDSQLIADGSNNFVRNNAVQGIDIETTETSSFGDPSVVVPGALGRRVLFDGNTVTDNGVDGLWATADEGSYLLLEVTSTRVPTVSGAHAALNTNGDSNYSRNGSDGIHIDAFGGSTVDVKITADTGSTFIQDNGTSGFAFGGVFVDARGSATGEVNVMNSVITGTVAGASEDTNGNGVLDASEDLNGNDDIDVLGGDGIAYNSTDSSDVNLTVGGAAGMGNVIQGNGDDGIAITLTNTSFPGITTPEITISNNLIGGESSGVAAGNTGDGISIASFGRTEAGNPAPDFEGGLNYTNLGNRAGAGELPLQFTQGPTPTITVDANTISRNNRNGVNIRLNGANGLTNLRPSPLEPNLALINRITLTDNVIVSNGEDGVTMRADTDMNQNRNVFLEPIIVPPVPPAIDPTLEDNQDFTTANVFDNNLADPLGYDSNDLFPGTYLNLQTVQNTLLTVTGNTIQSNGTNTVVGRGLELLVGTGAYVGADVRDNTFGGNLEQDLFTNSFLSTEEEVFASIDNGGGGLGAEGDPTDDAALYDVVFLEDAALLDMRFTNNTGDQILITSILAGAEYDIADPLKAPPTGDVIRHFAEVFKIDGFGTGDLATNTFVELGVPQDVQGAFGAFRIQNLSTELTWPEDPFRDND